MTVERLPRVWTYPAGAMTRGWQGWRHPVWIGSDEWPGSPDTHWRPTLVLRVPGRRYLVIVLPFRLRLPRGDR